MAHMAIAFPRPPDLASLLGSWDRGGPGYLSLARGLQAAILDGRFPLRARLPSERALAQTLGVSRTTTTAAYNLLRSEGFVESRRGSGSRTALPQGGTVDSEVTAGGVRPEPFEGIDLTRASLPAPSATVAAVDGAVRQLPSYLGGHGYDPYGVPSLRTAIAAMHTARGVPTVPDQILVTSGAQSALTLLLDVLAAPGDAALVEVPTYPHALDALRRAGVRLVPAPIRPEGWDLDLVGALLRSAVPQLAYTICDFHNPTGCLMSDADRRALVAGAERTGTQVIVDESFAELDLGGPSPQPRPLASHAPDGRVFTIGSMSKAFWGGLRIGWIRAPQPIVHRLARVRASRDLATPVLDQLVAVELLAVRGEVLRERRSFLRERRDALVRALRDRIPTWRFEVPRGGLCLWVELDGPHSEPLAELAEQNGVRVVPGPSFAIGATHDAWLRIPFTQPPAVLEMAVERLAESRHRLSLGAGSRRVAAVVT